LRDDYNKLYDHFTTDPQTRKDIIIARIDGDEDPKLADLLSVHSYPRLFLFLPEKPRFPISFDYNHDLNTMIDFLENLPYLSNPDAKSEEESSKKTYHPPQFYQFLADSFDYLARAAPRSDRKAVEIIKQYDRFKTNKNDRIRSSERIRSLAVKRALLRIEAKINKLQAPLSTKDKVGVTI